MFSAPCHVYKTILGRPIHASGQISCLLPVLSCSIALGSLCVTELGWVFIVPLFRDDGHPYMYTLSLSYIAIASFGLLYKVLLYMLQCDVYYSSRYNI